MDEKLSRRRLLALGAASSVTLAGCGMILHPERRNQPPGGGLDWSIVALDGLGLLLFFIPGVIAFAVDFATGAIYLPPPGYGRTTPGVNDQPLVEVHVPRDELTQRRLEQVASEHAGQQVKLEKGSFLTAPLARIADFWSTRQRLATS